MHDSLEALQIAVTEGQLAEVTTLRTEGSSKTGIAYWPTPYKAQMMGFLFWWVPGRASM
jgi:hypothetical protein